LAVATAALILAATTGLATINAIADPAGIGAHANMQLAGVARNHRTYLL
jgi:hypothetical protein